MKIRRKIQSALSIGIVDRHTGNTLAQTPIRNAKNPHLLPPPQSVVWHYLKYEFFESLLESGALRLGRLDSQSDGEDGLLLEPNHFRKSPEVEQLFKKAGWSVAHDWPAYQNTNNILRASTYVHCWSIRTKESAWMWWSFLNGNHRSVAIRSSVARLLTQTRLIASAGCGIARVRYYPRNHPKPDWSYTAPFLAKDESFQREQELRVLVTEPIENRDERDYRMVPVDLNSLIERVVLHPMASADFRKVVQSKLRANGLQPLVTRSSLREVDLLAVEAKYAK